MMNETEYVCQAFVGNTLVDSRIFMADDFEAAKQETRRWLSEKAHTVRATQVVLLLEGKTAWATPLPEKS